jgi:hypothetical protein
MSYPTRWRTRRTLATTLRLLRGLSPIRPNGRSGGAGWLSPPRRAHLVAGADQRRGIIRVYRKYAANEADPVERRYQSLPNRRLIRADDGNRPEQSVEVPWHALSPSVIRIARLLAGTGTQGFESDLKACPAQGHESVPRPRGEPKSAYLTVTTGSRVYAASRPQTELPRY